MTDIVLSTTEDKVFTDRLDQLLDEHAIEAGFPFNNKTINLTAEIDGTFAGGLHAYTLYGWCFIKLLVIEPKHRGKGIGRDLMTRLETEMRSIGIKGLWVDTYGYQAEGLYTGLGFTEYGRLPGRVPEEDRIYLTKQLTGEPAP
ncbi:MAG: GNAT family N-acetyltransferase [Pseudomonadota bacterium]